MSREQAVIRGSLESMIKRGEVLLLKEEELKTPMCIICNTEMDFKVLKEDNNKYRCCEKMPISRQ